MQFKAQVTVIGAVSNKGVMENGNAYDYTRLYVLNELTGEGKSGFAQSEYNYGKSDNFTSLRGLQYPFKAEVTCEVMTTGKVQKIEVIDFKPIQKEPLKA